MDGSQPRTGRRRLLWLLGAAALAGCSAGGGGSGATPGESTLTAAPLPDATATARDRRVAGSNSTGGELDLPWYDRTATTTLSPAGRTVAFHPRPTGLPGLAGGGRFGRPGTPDGPARLVLTLANADEGPVSLAHDPIPGRLATPEGGARAFLLPPASPDHAGEGIGYGGRERGESHEAGRDRTWLEGCWRGRPTGTGGERVEVPPDDRVSLAYDLVAGPEGSCLPVGTYAFETGFGWAFTLGVWRTDAPGPGTRSTFAGADVPGLPGGGPTEWFHRADRSTAVYLRPSTERIPLADGAALLRVTLFNHAPTTLAGNPIEYGLLKLHEGSWHHVAPSRLPSPEGHLPQGATLRKRFELRHGPPPDRDDAIPVGHLGGGRYAVRFGMHPPGRPRQYAALLGIDAPDLELSPAPELRVEGGESGHPIGWLDPDGRLFDTVVTAARTDEPADRTVVAERVMHEPVLRNTLSLFDDGVETVELHTRTYVADRLLRPGETLRVSLRGTTYRLARRED